jgi:hypothetical protein
VDGVDTEKVVEVVVELAEVGESGSGGSSGGDGGGDDGSSAAVDGVGVTVVRCSSRLLIRSSSDGRALSRGLPNPNIRSAEMAETRCE